jgi:polyvinyl alcohol dehydrogenase (cytochrome)
VYSLAANTGCIYWSFPAAAGVRTPVIIGNGPARGVASVGHIAYFGDVRANVYAVDADTGRLIWKTQVDKHPQARITGGLVLQGDQLFVPISSLEEASGNDSHYECCTFRGSVVALEASSGNQIWKTYTIQEAPKPVKKSSNGTQLWAPAGGAVWNTPTVDVERGELYFGTRNAYTAPAAPTTDSVMALDLKNGRILWWRQVVEHDAWVIGCGRDDTRRTDHCPDRSLQNSTYFDVDMGASPILHRKSVGHCILITLGEAGLVNALDPAREGKVIWTADLGDVPKPQRKVQMESQPGVAFWWGG